MSPWSDSLYASVCRLGCQLLAIVQAPFLLPAAEKLVVASPIPYGNCPLGPF